MSGSPHGDISVILDLAAFGLFYLLLAWDRWPAYRLSLIFGGVLLLGQMPAHAANFLYGMHLPALFLIAAMMILAGLLGESGWLDYIGRMLLHRGGRVPAWAVIYIMAAVASAFLDNVTTVVFLAPMLRALIKPGEKSYAFSLLFAAILGSNLGGLATLIGDPPNLLIGDAAHLTFGHFFVIFAPASLVLLAVNGLMLFWWERKWGKSTPRVADDQVKRAENAKLYGKRRGIGGIVLGVLVFFFLPFFDKTWELSVIALTGVAIALGYAGFGSVRTALKALEWRTLLFLIGVFWMVEALSDGGVLARLAGLLEGMAGMPAFPWILLGSAALVSSLVDNIPFVVAMIPVVL
ncbi:MAG: SLC13 family permease, partial [Firmicutes bacterium]|nr:SLC13 family permease [Bacillota bacterium]